MKIVGYGLIVFSILFLLGAIHAIRMYGIQGDPRWVLSIIGCPLFGGLTAAIGWTMAHA